MSYQPFLIANYNEGLRQDIEPWLLPQEGFIKFENAEIEKGIVKKRQGYQKIIEYRRLRASIASIALVGNDPVEITTISAHGLANGNRVTFNSVTTTEINSNEYTVSSATATTFELSGTDSANFSAGSGGYVYYFSGDAITGIMNYVTSSGTNETLIADTKTIGVYNQTSSNIQGLYDNVATINAITIATPGVVTTVAAHGLTDGQYVYIDSVVGTIGVNTNVFRVANSTGTTFELEDYTTTGTYTSDGFVYLIDNLFSGSSSDYFQSHNYQNTLFMTNGIDRVFTYNGTLIDKPNIIIDTGSTNNVSRVKIIKAQKSRVELLNTVEDSVNYFQRGRTSAFASTTDYVDFDSGGQGAYEDATVSDQIVSAQLLYDNLIVQFDNSTWLYRYSGNAFQPFRWELIDSTFKNGSRMGTEQFDRFIMSIGITGITVCDGSRMERIDQKIPDFMELLDVSEIPNMFMKRFKQNDKVWTTYRNTDDGTTRDKILEYNYKNQSWATHDLSFNVLSEYTKESDTETWGAFAFTYNQFTRKWNDEQFQADYPVPISGDLNGIVWQLFQSAQDGIIGDGTDGTAYNMLISTKNFNPYTETNRNSDLGSVSLLLSPDEGKSLTMQYFQDNQDSPTEIDGNNSITISLTPPFSTANKFWKKIVINSEAAFHRFEFSNNELNALPEIHAMLLEFRPGGILERYA